MPDQEEVVFGCLGIGCGLISLAFGVGVVAIIFAIAWKIIS